MTTYLSNNVGVLYDTRNLENDGRYMHIHLVLQMTDGRIVEVNRYFIKSNLTCEELLEQTDTNVTKRYDLSFFVMLSPREEEFDSD